MGAYAGTGKATLLNANQQAFFWSNERIAAMVTLASVAFQLERQKAAAYPWGFAVEITFSGAPGTFEVDIQGAEQDQDASYILLGATGITTVSTGNVARFEGLPYYPKFVRAFIKTKPTNDVNITGLLTR